MSVTSGFYNSLNGDRRYNAKQISMIFDGIISDGVYASVGTAFMVTASGGNTIAIGVGRAWFNHTWVYNDAVLSLTAEAPDVVLNRYDAVIIETNQSDSVRDGVIKIVKGVGSKESPSYPTLINNTSTVQRAIAYIYRPANSSAITQSNITYNVGTEECPYVTGPLEVHSIENIVAQWRGQFYEWLSELNVILGDDVATELAARVLALENNISTSAINRSIFRGKNLGSSITTEQLAAIRDGSFRNLFLGDYWEMNGTTWRIVDFDYWYNSGDVACTKHHLVIMPDVLYELGGSVSTERMNESATTSGGYVGSDFRTSVLPNIKSIITASFGDKILTHREYLIDDVSSNTGTPNGGAWYDASVELPEETMMYGSRIQAANYNYQGYGGLATSYTVNKTQLALFSVRPEYISVNGGSYWLRDIRTLSSFCFVENGGLASYTKASNVRNVRPVFAIG